jgi:hypothetical protein
MSTRGNRRATYDQGNYASSYTDTDAGLLSKQRIDRDPWLNLDEIVTVSADGRLSYSATTLQQHLAEIGGTNMLAFVHWQAETYQSWHARIFPARRADAAFVTVRIKTLHKALLDLAPETAAPSYVRISVEEREYSLVRFNKGLEMILDRYMAPGGYQELTDKLEIVASATVLTLKMQTLGALLNVRNKYRAYNAVFGTGSDAAVRAEVEREDARLTGILAKNEKGFYLLKAHAVERMRTENARPNMAVFPYNKLDTYAFSDFETEASRRGADKVEQRLTRGGDSLVSEYGDIQVYQDDQLNLPQLDRDLIQFLEQRVALGQFFIMSGAPFEKYAGTADFDAPAMLQFLYHDVENGDKKQPLTFERALRHSMRFNADGELDAFHDALAERGEQYKYRSADGKSELVDPFIHKNTRGGADVWERVRVIGDMSEDALPISTVMSAARQLAYGTRLVDSSAADGTSRSAIDVAIDEGNRILDDLAVVDVSSPAFQAWARSVADSPNGKYGVPALPVRPANVDRPYGYASFAHAQEIADSENAKGYPWLADQGRIAALRKYVAAGQRLYSAQTRQFEGVAARQAGTGAALAKHPYLSLKVQDYGTFALGRVRLPVYIRPVGASADAQARQSEPQFDALRIANAVLGVGASDKARDRLVATLQSPQFRAQLAVRAPARQGWTQGQINALRDITAAQVNPIAVAYMPQLPRRAGESQDEYASRVVQAINGEGAAKLAELFRTALAGTDPATAAANITAATAAPEAASSIGAPRPTKFTAEDGAAPEPSDAEARAYQRTGLVLDGESFRTAKGAFGEVRPADPRQPLRPLVDEKAAKTLAKAHASRASDHIGPYRLQPDSETAEYGAKVRDARQRFQRVSASQWSSNYVERYEKIQSATSSAIERASALAYITAPVTLQTLLALVDKNRGNTLPPVTLLVLRPWNVFDMHAVLWAQAGDGEDRTGDAVFDYDHFAMQPTAVTKQFIGHMTLWLGAYVLREERVYFTPKVGFSRYHSGFDDRLFSSVQEVHDVVADQRQVLHPEDGRDFKPAGFVALCGASTRPNTVREPLYLTGAVDHTLYPGVLINDESASSAAPQYDSARYYTALLRLDLLNAEAQPEATTFAQYKQSAALNTCMYQGDQRVWSVAQKGYVEGYKSAVGVLPAILPDGARAVFDGLITVPELEKRQPQGKVIYGF